MIFSWLIRFLGGITLIDYYKLQDANHELNLYSKGLENAIERLRERNIFLEDQVKNAQEIISFHKSREVKDPEPIKLRSEPWVRKRARLERESVPKES